MLYAGGNIFINRFKGSTGDKMGVIYDAYEKKAKVSTGDAVLRVAGTAGARRCAKLISARITV